ncbi:MAG: toll/interleukin-1 receptor domain-containing protein [Mediterranea sp.]|jgi:tetratricopeptide (TPR) repeat protein|nr:toll/interleukin-1 receptor domain-containing protein [Mediterranea sp.]
MSLIRKAKGLKVREQSQRIFLCLDVRNIQEADRLIADRLLPAVPNADYIVSYLEMPGADPDKDLLRNELKNTSIMVLWVTEELLDSRRSCGHWPAEYQLARELSVPIIPVVEDGALFPEFSRLSDAVHGIGMTDKEYLLKYTHQLSSFLYTEDEIKLIREKAFTAEVFLSYRKRNIREAREFMRKLHDIKGFETISVWYDHSLTAGRNFNDEIKDSIKRGDAFVLLVTPDLATEGNYVQTTEYPFAQENGKTIIPVEATPTDVERFETLYPGAGQPVPVDNLTSLRDTFIEKLKLSITDEPMSNERTYFLGLAYLSGNGVEIDRNRAIWLLENVAEGDDFAALHACFPLCHHYSGGITASTDYKKAYYYHMRVVVLSEQFLGDEHHDTAEAYYNMANLCLDRGDFEQASKWGLKATKICEKAFGAEHPNTATMYSFTGRVLIHKGDYTQALTWLEKALEIYQKTLATNDPKIATTYGNLSTAYIYLGNFTKALDYSHKTLAVYEDLYGKNDSRTAILYQNIGGIYNELKDYPTALEWLNKALTSQEKAFMSNEHRDIAITYNTLAVVYSNLKQHNKSLEVVKKALSINVRTLGMSHPDTVNTQESMANLLAAMHLRRNLKAIKWVLLVFCLIGLIVYVLLK